jgi:hypothetical protein
MSHEAKVRNWLKLHGDDLACAVCKKKDHWHVRAGLACPPIAPDSKIAEGKYVVLTCDCGYSVFVNAAAVDL